MRVRVPPLALQMDNQIVAYFRFIKNVAMGKLVGKVPAKSADVVDIFTALELSPEVRRSHHPAR
jgi:hypothetical protein